MANTKPTPTGANKYSVYAQRNAEDTEIDWGKVATDIGKDIEEIRLDRETRKAEIETINQSAIEELSKLPDTNSQDAGSLLINGSASSVDATMVQYKLMKRNKISPRQFKLFVQNQKNGYKGLSNALGTWDAWWTKANTRLNENKSGYLEVANNELLSNLGNLKNKKLMSNPINGKFYMVEMGYNEKTKAFDIMPDQRKNPGAFTAPNLINDLQKYEQPKFNLKEQTTKLTTPIASVITATIAAYSLENGGKGITTIEDFRQIGDFSDGVSFDDWKEAQINALVGSPESRNNDSAGQALANSGSYYAAQTVEDFKKAHPGLDTKYWIKFDNTSGAPQIELTENQQKEARRLANIEIEAQISAKITKTSGLKGTQPTQLDYLKGEDLKLKNESLEITNNIVAGDLDQYVSAGSRGIIDVNKRLTESGLSSEDDLIDSIKRQGDEIIITYQSGRESMPIKRKNEDGTFRTTEEIGKEVHQLISAYGSSYDEDAKNYKKKGKTFTKNTRDMTDKEIVSELEIEKAKEYLIGAGTSNPTPKQITDIINSKENEIPDITAEELKKAKKEGIPKVYRGEDAEQFSSRKELKSKNVGDNITKNVGSKLNDITGAESIKQGYNAATDNNPDNLTTDGSLWGGPGDRAKALQEPMQKALNAYLPRQLRGTATITLTDKGKIEVKNGKKDLTIVGVTDITIGKNETFVKLDGMVNTIAKSITVKLRDQEKEGQ